MIRYKINVLDALKEKGYTTYRLRKEALLGDSTIARLRKSEPIAWKALDQICTMLKCNVGDVIEHLEDSAEDD